ncbi:RNA polymerase factor sigma-54 [Simkania negevensis]|uniref:RNA polymerase factor sigma-54 n=1 Tax=Simkania negevensis TaxID=83561 RepID=A0ABS3APH6_9BACT|nr:RNA polymerase factor sigma-54 [Simkania negevensis]
MDRRQLSLHLGHEQVQSLKQTQRLIMSPQMQQAIHLLQVPVLELSAMIDAELRENPLLELEEESRSDDQDLSRVESENGEADAVGERSEEEIVIDDSNFEVLKQLDAEFDDYHNEMARDFSRPFSSREEEEKRRNYLESSVPDRVSIYDFLMRQAWETFEERPLLRAAELIIGHLDEKGFLTTPLEEISLLNEVDRDDLRFALEKIQTFEPYGVGAHDVHESLLIQLRCLGKEEFLAYAIVARHYDDLLHNRIPLIKKGLRCTLAQIREAIEKDIALLNLAPGTEYALAVPQYITADITVELEEGGGLRIEVNNDAIPAIRLNRKYLRLLKNPDIPEQTKEYIKQKIASGKWLLRNIDQRNDTLYRIAAVLIEKQKNFLSSLEGHLQPMTMKSIAEELELHESTIARAISNKYIDCPRGLIALRSFFTHGYVTSSGDDISSDTVKEVLLKIISQEEKQRPLSDEKLSKLLVEHGINCARRTVAKYRRLFHIGNASQRRTYN